MVLQRCWRGWRRAKELEPYKTGRGHGGPQAPRGYLQPAVCEPLIKFRDGARGGGGTWRRWEVEQPLSRPRCALCQNLVFGMASLQGHRVVLLNLKAEGKGKLEFC
jgi:hypothetical protein